MDLIESLPGNHNTVREISDRGIRVGAQWHTRSLLVSVDRIVTDWPVRSTEELDAVTLEPVFALEPEVVVLGAGPRQWFPAESIRILFLRRALGVESMSLAAAARTFNVLAAEGRRVVAALIQTD